MTDRQHLYYRAALPPRILDDRAQFATLLRVQRDALARAAAVRGGELTDAPLQHDLLPAEDDPLTDAHRALLAEHGVTVREPRYSAVMLDEGPSAVSRTRWLVSTGYMRTRRLWDPHGPVLVADPAVPPGEGYLLPAGWRDLVDHPHADPTTPEQWRQVVARLGPLAAIISNPGGPRGPVTVAPVDQDGQAPDTPDILTD